MIRQMGDAAAGRRIRPPEALVSQKGGRRRFSRRCLTRRRSTIEQTTRSELIASCQKGDRQAQEQLILAVQDQVFRRCLRLLQNEDDALDAAQDILIAMLTGLPQLRTPEAFDLWLHQITGHVCGKRVARNIRYRRITAWYYAHTAQDRDRLDDQLTPDGILDTEETRRMIVELVDALPPIQRLCVLLYYYDEMSVKDIAAALEVPEGTIKSRLYYARRTIKKRAERTAAQGTPLYGLSPLPFLQYFLQRETPGSGLSAAVLHTLTQAVLAGAASAAAVTGTAAAATALGTLAGRGALVLASLLLTAAAAGTLLPHASAPDPAPAPEPAVQTPQQAPRQKQPPSAPSIPVTQQDEEPLPQPEPVSQPAAVSAPQPTAAPAPQPAALTFTPTPPSQEPEPVIPPESILPPETFYPFVPPEPDPAPSLTFEPEPLPAPEPELPQPVQAAPAFLPELIPSISLPVTEPEPGPNTEPELIKYDYTFNSDFSGTFLGINDEGVYEFETTIQSDQDFEQCPLFTTGCWGPLELSNPACLGEAVYAFYGKAPGTCDVTYYIGGSPEGPFDRKAAVVHVTVEPPEPLTYNDKCGKLAEVREDGVYILEMDISEEDKQPQPHPFLSGPYYIRYTSSNPDVVDAQSIYFCAASPGTAEVCCYIRYTKYGAETLKAIIHVTVTPAEEEEPLPPSPLPPPLSQDAVLGLPFVDFTMSKCISGGYLGPNEDGVFIFESTILADDQFHAGPLIMRNTTAYYLESSDLEVADFSNDYYRGLTPGTADIYYYTACTKDGPYYLRAILHVTVQALE